MTSISHLSARMRGFTLLEILVALAVLGVAAAGLVGASISQLRSAERLENQLLASWIADNRLTEARLFQTFPVGEGSEEVAVAGRRWQLSLVSAESGKPGIKKLTARVTLLQGTQKLPMAELTGWVRP